MSRWPQRLSTLLFEMPSNPRRKNFVCCYCPQNENEMYLQEVNTLRFWLKVHVDGKCPQIMILNTCRRQMANAFRFMMQKKRFDHLRNDFWPFKNNSWTIISEIWWYLPFAGTFNQNCSAFTCCWYFQSESKGIYLLQVLSISFWGH